MPIAQGRAIQLYRCIFQSADPSAQSLLTTSLDAVASERMENGAKDAKIAPDDLRQSRIKSGRCGWNLQRSLYLSASFLFLPNAMISRRVHKPRQPGRAASSPDSPWRA